MKDILETLRNGAPAHGSAREKRIERSTPGQADARSASSFCSTRVVRGIRHVRRTPARSNSAWKDQGAGRRRGHRLGTVNGRKTLSSPRILPCSAARCPNPCAEDRQDPGHGDEGEAPIIGLYDAGGRASRKASRHWRLFLCFRRNVIASGVIPQISVIMALRADVYSPPYRLHLHGEEYQLHVRHGPTW